MPELTARGRGRLGIDPFEDIRENMERVLSAVLSPSSLLGSRIPVGGTNTGISAVPVDIVENEQAYQVVAEVPGLTEQDIDITCGGDTLTIRGRKQETLTQLGGQGGQGGQQGGTTGRGQQQEGRSQQGQGQQQEHYLVSERSYGEFRRSFQIPPNVDRNQIRAEVNRGLLTLTIPKSTEAQQAQRRIEVRPSTT